MGSIRFKGREGKGKVKYSDKEGDQMLINGW